MKRDAESEKRKAEAEQRVREFLESEGRWPERKVPDPVEAPTVPWFLTEDDQRFLRVNRIDPER